MTCKKFILLAVLLALSKWKSDLCSYGSAESLSIKGFYLHSGYLMKQKIRILKSFFATAKNKSFRKTASLMAIQKFESAIFISSVVVFEQSEF